MLHTIIPLDIVTEGIEAEGKATSEVKIQGILMQVMPLDDGTAKIVRLLDCPLNSYLNPALAPGSIIRYIPTM